MYRFIVDKFAGMTLAMAADVDQQATVNDFLVSMLQEAWTHFLGVITQSTAQKGATAAPG